MKNCRNIELSDYWAVGLSIRTPMTQSGQETVNLEFIFFYFLYLSIIVGRGLKIVVKLNFGLGLGAYFKQGCWTIEDGQRFP